MSRKHLSGSGKRKKRKREEEFIKSQSGALDRFIQKKPEVSSHNQNTDNIDPNNVGVDGDQIDDVNVDGDHVDYNAKDDDVEYDNIGDDANANVNHVDIFDPRNLEGLTSDMIKTLVEKGPKRDYPSDKGPVKLSRRFSATMYTRILPNRERCDREWLVYSKKLDKVFCFCCKIFRKGHPKGQLDNEGYGDWQHLNQDALFSAEENFKVNYFLYIVDQASASLETRFEQFKEYERIFGFLFPKKLKELDDKDLKSCCSHLEDALKYDGRSDLDAHELYMELKLLDTFLPSETIKPNDVLKYLKEVDCFPNAIIAYRVLLTIPVTVTSVERSFSKFKLLKSYLRSRMSQERLNGLSMIVIENDILENIDYEELIIDFASNNARRTSRFI